MGRRVLNWVAWRTLPHRGGAASWADAFPGKGGAGSGRVYLGSALLCRSEVQPKKLMENRISGPADVILLAISRPETVFGGERPEVESFRPPGVRS